jgi:hypothetical protein
MLCFAELLVYPRPIGVGLIRAAAHQAQYGEKRDFPVTASLDLVTVLFQIAQRILSRGGQLAFIERLILRQIFIDAFSYAHVASFERQAQTRPYVFLRQGFSRNHRIE